MDVAFSANWLRIYLFVLVGQLFNGDLKIEKMEIDLLCDELRVDCYSNWVKTGP